MMTLSMFVARRRQSTVLPSGLTRKIASPYCRRGLTGRATAKVRITSNDGRPLDPSACIMRIMRSTRKSLALAQHVASLGACERCGLGPDVRPVISRASNPRAMLVGQAPGKVESEGGRPFSGRAGKTLFRWLAGAGIDEATARETIYIAAITRCYPGPHPSGRGDRVPTRQEQASCGDWLESELRIIRPKLLIPVGRLAIERFLPPVPLAELIGTKHVVNHVGGRSIVIPLPHPSGASSWVYEAGNSLLVQKAIDLIADELGVRVA